MLKSKLLTNYLPFPYLSHHYSDRKLSWENCSSARLYLQPTHPPKTLPGGEEINKGDWTIPPTLAEIQNKKNYPIQPSNQLEENLDKKTVKFHLNEWFEWFKMIPFRFAEKEIIKYYNRLYCNYGITLRGQRLHWARKWWLEKLLMYWFVWPQDGQRWPNQ